MSGLDYGLISDVWNMLAVIPEQPAISQGTASTLAVPRETASDDHRDFFKLRKSRIECQRSAHPASVCHGRLPT